MPSSEKIAIAAHLHVLLRRKTGRVTDTEWMAGNQEYAAEITRFAREKAAEDGHADLAGWADKLEEIMGRAEPRQRVPLVRIVSEAVRERGALPAGAAPVTVRQAPPVNAVEEANPESANPESGFMESTFGSFFGEGDPGHPKKQARDPNAPRYVKGLR